MIKKAESSLELRKSLLEGFVTAYAEEEAKKRKKKLRIARIEKTDEELAFEADRGGSRYAFIWMYVFHASVTIAVLIL